MSRGKTVLAEPGREDNTKARERYSRVPNPVSMAPWLGWKTDISYAPSLQARWRMHQERVSYVRQGREQEDIAMEGVRATSGRSGLLGKLVMER